MKNLLPSTSQKLTLATALVQQYDNLVTEEIGARYSFEVASSRPPTKEITANNNEYKQRTLMKQWEIAASEATIQKLTGLAVEDLREVGESMLTLFNRISEVRQELRNRTLLTPSLLKSLEGIDTPEATEGRSKSETAISEVPTLEAHLDALVAQIDALAEGIQYNDLSELVLPARTIVRP